MAEIDDTLKPIEDPPCAFIVAGWLKKCGKPREFGAHSDNRSGRVFAMAYPFVHRYVKPPLQAISVLEAVRDAQDTSPFETEAP